MRPATARLLSLTLASLFACASYLHAQYLGDIEQGIKPYGSYHGGDIDTISMTNGALQVRIPLVSLPQRGGRLKVDYTLLYETPYYTYTDNCQNDPNPSCIPTSYVYHLSYGQPYSLGNSGWGVPFGIVTDFVPRSMAYHYNSQGVRVGKELREWNGTLHLLNGVSQDATGYTSSFNGGLGTYGTEILIDKYGTRYYFPYVVQTPTLNVPGAPNKVEDVNGNMITLNSATTGVWTDTFGRQLGGSSTSTTDYSGCTGTLTTVSAYIMSYPAPNGGTTQFKFCNAQFSVAYTPPGCSGTCHPINAAPVTIQSVVLWNGTSWASSSAWTFALNSYGALSKVTFPTGGSISYTSTVASPGGECFTYTDEWRTNYMVLTTSRTVDANDGTGPHGWIYNNGNTTAYTAFQTVVTDPNLNDTVHKETPFGCSAYETEQDQYSGSYTAGTLLKKTVTTYNQTSSIDPNVAADVVPLTITTTDMLSGKSSQVAMTYDPGSNGHIYGNVLTKKEYDFDGSLLRNTVNQYMIFSGPNAASYLANNLNSLLYTTQVQNGAGTQMSLTKYNYDETAPASSGLTSANQWDTAPPSGTYRGNNTSVYRWLSPSGTFTCPSGHSGGSGGYLISNKTYFDDGMLNTSADPCGNATTYAYSATYWGALPTTVSNALNQSTTNVYDFNTGLLTSTTDPNNLQTTYSYDSMLRLSQVNRPDGGQDTITHQETSFPFSVTLTSKINSSLSKVQTNVFDGVGQVTQTQLTSDPQGTVFTDTTYDALGRIASVSNPYRSGTDVTSSPGTTTYGYDAISRKITITYPGGSVLNTAYCGPSTLVTDPSGKWRRSRVDGLGRLVEVDEPNAVSASVNSNGCPGTGEPIWVTTYTLDALGNLTQVVQNSSHQRSFTYDSLSRLLTSSNPETGAITYTYNPDGTLLTKQDGRLITTSYTWDALLRQTGATYSNGDPSITYTYDQSNCLSLASCQNIGHRTAMTDGAGSELWAYRTDPTNFRSIHREQRTNNSSPSNITKTTTYYLDLAGNVTQLFYPTGRTVNYGYDAADRPKSSTDSSSGVTYVTGWQTPPPSTHCISTGVCYTPQGSVYSMALGHTSSFTGINVLETYNNRLQPNEIKASAPFGNALDITYNFVDPVSGGNAGVVYGISNLLNSARSQTFTYDQLNRITSAGTTSTTGTYCWGYLFSYDPYGNLLSQAGWTPTYNACTESTMGGVTADGSNHISGFSYDTAGNTLGDGVYTYTWNGESQIKTANGVTYNYDGDGRRAAKVGSKLYWYGSGGEILAETDASGNVQNEYVFFGGKRVALVPPTGAQLYYMEDMLGSSRLIATTSAVCYDADFTPFGGERAYTNTCAQNYKFEGKERDAETQNDDFGAREYTWRFGRWLSSDWSGTPEPVPYANLSNPQTLNLYAMVEDDPESFADLDGHSGDMNPGPASGSLGGDGCSGFWYCLSNALVSDNLAGLNRQSPTNSSGTVGAAVGDFVATIQGGVETLVGGVAQGGGVAACGTGVGCAVTPAAVTAGTAMEVHGVATASEGLGHLVTSAFKSTAESGSSGGGSSKPSLSDHKEALKQVHGKVGKQPKGQRGKFGSPQRGTPKKGYRLDPGHPNAPNSAERNPHINYWDYTSGKRGAGGISGAVPIPPED